MNPFQKNNSALTDGAHWTGLGPSTEKSPVGLPVRGHIWVAGLVLGWGVQEAMD